MECSNQIKRHFPDLSSEFSSLDDPRLRKDYSLEEILMGGLSLFLFKQGSRNSLNNKRREESFSTTYAHHFGLRLPHQDSICEVLSHIPPEKLDQVKMDLMSELFKQKVLRKYRLFDQHYLVVVFGCTETRRKDIPAGQKPEQEPTVHHFEYVTNLTPNCDNILKQN